MRSTPEVVEWVFIKIIAVFSLLNGKMEMFYTHGALSRREEISASLREIEEPRAWGEKKSMSWRKRRRLPIFDIKGHLQPKNELIICHNAVYVLEQHIVKRIKAEIIIDKYYGNSKRSLATMLDCA